MATKSPLQQQQASIDVNLRREQLLNEFQEKTTDLEDNTAYYESERRPDAIGISVPPEMQELLAHVGYPRLYVNALADRLKLEGFRMGGAEEADEKLWDWWQANQLDVESTLGHVDALVHGRSYVTVSAPDPQFDFGVDPKVPIIRVEPPTNLYAKIDPKSRLVTEAIRAIYDENGNEVVSATLYLLDQTVYFDKVESEWVQTRAVQHNMGIVPVVPLANRTRLSDLYGTTEITPELRSVTDAAARTLMLMQSTAELMGVPLRLLFGVTRRELGIPDDDEAVTPRQAFEAYYARILGFEAAEGKAYQFDAAELRNFVDSLDALDKKAAAYTGLPPQYLSFSSDNPASAEAIRSSESRLVMNAERKALIFGGAWEQVMRVAHKVMNPGSEIPPAMFRLEAIWADPSTPTYAAKADAASKLYNQGNGIIPKEQARIDMGYSVETRRKMKEWDKEENPVGQLAGLYAPRPGQPQQPEKQAPNEPPAKEVPQE
ncbi:portal protein [Mycobacterium phage Rockstar]|uniref:Portal protein n=2 Tax=Veracruzvirus rockstar TaxID=2003502 RepID=G1BRB1_9CAUD|nr:portal protein [Mycobacterium phage Rockstar]AEK07378.1 portal protein [Mycobacterium phage Rockstar]QGJ97296.1 portal protein [Mycobacterium phage Isca]